MSDHQTVSQAVIGDAVNAPGPIRDATTTLYDNKNALKTAETKRL